MIKNRFKIILRKELKELTRRIEHIGVFFENSDKFREFNSKRINENKFFYNNFSMLKMITVIKVRSIETNIIFILFLH